MWGAAFLGSAALLLSGCIPTGGNDYRIGSASEEPEAPKEPIIKAEREPIKATPSWSPATVERNGQQVAQSVYTVQPGDSLYRIESETGAGITQIIAANALVAPYTLRAGQKLIIPAGFYHRVGRGETGIAIARAYGVSWSDIVDLNGLQAPYTIRENMRLRLPDNASAVPVSSGDTQEQMAAAFTLDIDSIVTGSQPALPAPSSSAPSVAGQIARPGAFSGGFAWPVSGALLSRFGVLGGGRVNDGIDIAGADGTPVRASADGVVVYSGNEIGVYGGLVLIDHGSGWVTAYGHLGRLDVVRGAKVKAGQTIGGVGETGYVSQPQLHFEIRKDRLPIDPLGKLPAR